MTTIMVDIGGLGSSNTPGDFIKTMALGSCVAIILLHPRTRSVGMVHVALPDSSINTERAQHKPGYFADTGLPALMARMASLGCGQNGRDYMVKLAGGANVLDHSGTFNIGKRNVLAVKKLLWQRGMGAISEDVGGNISRTVTVDVATGKVILFSAGREQWEI